MESSCCSFPCHWLADVSSGALDAHKHVKWTMSPPTDCKWKQAGFLAKL